MNQRRLTLREEMGPPGADEAGRSYNASSKKVLGKYGARSIILKMV